jgi:hypothetical protein
MTQRVRFKGDSTTGHSTLVVDPKLQARAVAVARQIMTRVSERDAAL